MRRRGIVQSMKVVEKFISINGEGPHAGELAVFIRFQGCNLTCSYCDTSWANVEDCPYEEMSPREIADHVNETGVANVTLTGGEPLLQEEMCELLRLLSGGSLRQAPFHKLPSKSSGRARNYSSQLKTDREPLDKTQGTLSKLSFAEWSKGTLSSRIEIETNGSVDISPFCGEYRPVFTIDYKLPSSGCEEKMLTGNFALLERDDTVKFVCGSEEDLKRAKDVIEEYGLLGKCNIYLSPVFGRIEPERMVEYMVKHRMNGVRLQVQLHKVIWHPEKRGV